MPELTTSWSASIWKHICWVSFVKAAYDSIYVECNYGLSLMKLLSIAITLVGSLHVGIRVVNAAEPAKESVVVSTGQVDEL